MKLGLRYLILKGLMLLIQDVAQRHFPRRMAPSEAQFDHYLTDCHNYIEEEKLNSRDGDAIVVRA